MSEKFLSFLLCCLLWESSAKPTDVFLSYQDSLGQYSFGYSAPGSARSEVKSLNGAIRGAYSYVDQNGVIQSAEYVADDDGFHVIATNLPQAPLPVEETAEVAAARKEHLEALRLAERMAEESGNEETTSVLSRESVVDQSYRSEESETPKAVDEDNRKGFNITQESSRKEETPRRDDQEINPKEEEARTSEESTRNISNYSILKDRLPLENVPVFRITYEHRQTAENLANGQGYFDEVQTVPLVPNDKQRGDMSTMVNSMMLNSREQQRPSNLTLSRKLVHRKTPYGALIKFPPPAIVPYMSYDDHEKPVKKD